MKYLVRLFVLVQLCIVVNSHAQTWSWEAGSQYVNSQSNYQNVGIENTVNDPGSKVGAMSWADLNGNLWMFGGERTGFSPTNDLWCYNQETEMWRLVIGDTVPGNQGNSGLQGIPSPSNLPSARTNAVTWTDSNGNFWMFGGNGIALDGEWGKLNDLWKFEVNTQTWIWVGGSATVNQLSSHGVFGVESAGNYPGSRVLSSRWVIGDYLYMYGGDGASMLDFGVLADLWRYNTLTGQWAIIDGTDNVTEPRQISSLYQYNETNNPGRRTAVCSWTDGLNLYMYGGGKGDNIFFGDLWSYSLITNEWACISGDTTENCIGNYGGVGIAGGDIHPGAKFGAQGFFKNNELWIYGGYGYSNSQLWYTSDLWRFDLVANQWTYFGGGNTCCQFGIFGTQGVPSLDNHPGCKEFASGWLDVNGNFWISGGYGYASNTTPGVSGDLWKLSFCDQLSTQVNWNESGTLLCPNEWSKLSFSLNCSSNNNYAIGDIGPAGGVIFHDKGFYSEGWRFMEYFPMILETDKPWGCLGQFFQDTILSLGGGLENTVNVGAQCMESVASLCMNAELGGYSDWFLPSYNELLEIFNSGTYQGPSINFWSSSELDSNHAFYLNLPNGPEFEVNVFSKDADWFSTLAVRYVGQECTNQGQINNLVTGGWEKVTSYKGHHYLKWSEPLTFTAGQQLCEQSGGYLICLNDENEKMYVGDVLSNNTEFGDFWLGLYQNVNSSDYSEPSGGWLWSDGSSLDYSSWALNEPMDQWSQYNFGMFDYSNSLSWQTQVNEYLGTVIMEIPADVQFQSVNGDFGPSMWVMNGNNESANFLVSDNSEACNYTIDLNYITPVTVYHEYTITQGDSLNYNGEWLYTAGVYNFNFGCDSIVNIHLNLIYNFNCAITISDSVLCQGEIADLSAVVNFSSNPYPIGSVGPAGGIVFYDKGNDEGGWQYIEMAPEDISGTYQWGCYDGGLTGWGDIGDGQSIADSMLANCTDPIALNACLNYNYNGFNDWYLPSLTELNLIYNWAQPFSFNVANLSGMDFYWSSTPDYSNPNQNAFGYVFAPPNQGGLASLHPKSSLGKVRPIRYFSLIDYSWSTMDTVPQFAYAPAQNELIHCTMTLSNGQVCQDSVNVFVSNMGNESIEIIPMQNLLCSNSDSLGFYVHSSNAVPLAQYNWMIGGQTQQLSSDTIIWLHSTFENNSFNSWNNSYLTVSMGSDQLSCLALDSFYFSIENSVYGDYIPTTVSDWNILPGEMVQLILDIDTSIYFGSDYTFNWVINNQVISNVQDTIFNFENIQNNDILNCSIVANNSCMNIIVVPHTIFADEPMICEMIPLDSISCGEDSILMGMEILNSGLVIHDFNCTRDTILVSNSSINSINSLTDIVFIRANMEHSFHTDLGIKVYCPNGQHINIINSGGIFKFLGEPLDDQLFNEGVGWDYFWSSNAVNGTLTEFAATMPNTEPAIPSGYYSIQDSWDSLIGCPINGLWIIEICDVANYDNGFLFDWQIQFNSNNTMVQVEDVLQYNWSNGQNSPSSVVVVSTSNPPICDVSVFGSNCSSTYDMSTFIPQNYYADFDLDGFGDPSSIVLACAPAIGISSNSSDCNDMESSINPSEIDICENGIDDDCSGQDLSCSVWGCMDPLACNFNVNANQSDSSCTFIGQVCDDGDIWTLNDTLNDQCVCSGYLGTFCEVFPIVIEIDTIIDNACFAENEGQVYTSVSGGAGLYYVQWNTMPIQTTPFAINLTAGEFILTVTDTSGCSATITAAVSEPEGSFPIINGLTDVSSGENAQYSTEPCDSCEYVWSVSNGLILGNPDSLTLNVLWLEAAFGAVYLTRIDSSGCQVQSHISVDISASGLSENKSNAFLSIYPNPTRIGKFIIQTNGQDLRADMLKIFDITGKIVFQSQVVMNGNAVEVEFGDLATGMYLVMVGEERLRLIVE